MLSLALLYFVAGRLGLMLPAFGSHITLIWLPTGIAVASLVRCGSSYWPGIMLGAFAVNYGDGLAWPAVLGIAAGNTAGPLLAAHLLRRTRFHATFERKRDFLFLASAAVCGMLVSASCGVAVLASAGALTGNRVAAWLTWWGGDTMGVIAAAPLLLSCTREEWRTIASRRKEYFVWFCTTGLIAYAVFFLHPDPAHRMWTPSFLTLPLVAWAALRAGTIGTSLSIIMLSIAAAIGTATGRGPFSRGSPSDAAVVLWLYMATCAVLGWLIAALHAAQVKAAGLQHQVEEALQIASQKLRLHFEQTPMGVVEWDLQFHITQWNPAAQAIFGYSREEALGRHGSFIVPEKYRPQVDEVWQSLLKKIGGERSTNENVRQDGACILCEWYNTPLIDGQGSVIGVASLVMDISERKRAEEEIRALNANLERRVAERTCELQEANQELEAFSYSVSHDLKSPLQAVEGFASIIADGYADRLDDEGREMLAAIRTSTQRMGRLIDDLLTFSRLGRQSLESATVDMHELARDVFAGLAARVPRRKLRLDLRPLPAAHGTEPMIRQVWVNLIGNAIKFTSQREVGEIEIGAQNSGGEQIYYVKDNGAGFDMRHADRLFGVFTRLHSVDDFEGTGIGLALVQRIVSRHGGRVWGEAQVDRGATFCFTLPGAKRTSLKPGAVPAAK